MATGAEYITDEMFLVAALALAAQVTDADLAQASVYPPLTKIREVSALIAVAVADLIYEKGLARTKRPDDLLNYIYSWMYQPAYPDYVDDRS